MQLVGFRAVQGLLLRVQVGDRVILGGYSGAEIKIGLDTYQIVRETNISGVIEGEEFEYALYDAMKYAGVESETELSTADLDELARTCLSLIEEAGGEVTDWDGGPAWLDGNILAGPPPVHAELLRVVAT